MFTLCCRSNTARAPIANLPNGAQLGGIPYHYAKWHPGPCSNLSMRPRTDRQTHRHAWPQYILRRLRLTRNVVTMFMLLSSWWGHCESSPGSFDEWEDWTPTLKPSQLTWPSSPLVGCYHPHLPSPFIIITESVGSVCVLWRRWPLYIHLYFTKVAAIK